MGAHGTLDDALAGVAAARRSASPHDRRRRRSRSRSRERGRRSKDGSPSRRHKKSHRDRRGGDDGKRRHHHHRRHHPSPPPSPRAAAAAFVAAFPDDAASLRGLLAELDAGTGLDVDGVPSAEARALLKALLKALGAARGARGGPYELPASAPRALAVVGGVLGGGVEAKEEEKEETEPAPMVGPARPPPELLAAAAAAAAAAPYDDDDDGDDDEIGPAAPPDGGGGGGDDAAVEVSRIIAAIDAAAGGPPDPYAVLGVPPSASPATVRAALRRGALLTHPDKNDAPRAADAFAALAAAAAALRDPDGKAAVDARRAAADEAAALAAFVAGEARKAQWRAARGGGGAAAAAPQPATRDAWMTELPTAAGPAPPAPGKSVTAFSARGVGTVDAAWGLKPGDRPPALRGAAATGPAPTTTATNAAVDAFNAAHRGESLMAQHQRRGAAAPAAAQPDPDHPWTPWDREAAMAPGGQRRPVVADPAKEAAALKGRFATGGG